MFRSVMVVEKNNGLNLWFDGVQLPNYPVLPETDVKEGFDDLVLRCAKAFDHSGVLGVTNGVMEMLGGFKVPQGWKSYGRLETGWQKLTEHDQPKRTVVVMNLDQVDMYDCPLYTGDAGETGSNLAAWHTTMGSAFSYTSGVAGLTVFEDMRKATKIGGKYARRPAWKPEYAGMPWSDSSEWIYGKNSFVGTTKGKYLHGYDSNRHYLAAAGNAVVCANVLDHTGVIKFDKKLAGWWLVDVPPWNVNYLPHPAGQSGKQWLTTPTVELLYQMAETHQMMAPFDIEDSFTGTGTRLLAGWAKKMEQAYQTNPHNEALRTTLKDSMRSTLGLLNSPTSATYRPDWWQTVVGVARCNLFRKVYRAWQDGRLPYAIETDCVYYHSNNPDAIQAAPLAFVMGTGLGQFKVKEKS